MGRHPINPASVPHLRLRRRGHKVHYYYDHGGKPRHETALGTDYAKAIQQWAELAGEGREAVRGLITFRYVADRYRAEVIPAKGYATQKCNLRELASLIAFFDDPPAPIDSVEPQHIRQYMRWRKAAPVRANREKALFSHIWNWGREQGYTAKPNPCAGVHGNRERARVVYVEDGAYKATWDSADLPLRDAMDLLYLTGQRPSDVLRMDERDIRGGRLFVRQGKTGHAERMVISPSLAAVLARISKRKAALVVHATRLIVNESGQPPTLRALQGRLVRARVRAGTRFQLRDLRAKAGTDKTNSNGLREAQRQLGHANVTMTEAYVRNRVGDEVTPTK